MSIVQPIWHELLTIGEPLMREYTECIVIIIIYRYYNHLTNSYWLAGINHFSCPKKKRLHEPSLLTPPHVQTHPFINPEGSITKPKISKISQIASRLAIGRLEIEHVTKSTKLDKCWRH